MSLFDDYPEYSENDWKNEMDAAELSEMREAARETDDVEIFTARPCCEIPANYTHIPPTGSRDFFTGYPDEAFYECSCGDRIAESDYVNIVKWFERKNQIEPDAVPIEIDRRTRIEPKRVA